MFQKFKISVLCIFIFAIDVAAQEQVKEKVKPVRIAVMAPLYLDSAFNGTTYKLGDLYMPKYILPGLDFYNGTMQAIEQLQKEQANLEVWVYDTKSATKGINTLISELDKMELSLIIASITNATEQKAIATFASNSNIPVISPTYPNDAGLSANPFFVLINPTLKTHVEGIYDFIRKNAAGKHLLYMTKKGNLEETINTYFSAKNKAAKSLQYKRLLITDPSLSDTVLSNLDTARQNLIVCGTMDETFAEKILETLNASTIANMITIVGMPSWTSSKNLASKRYPNLKMVSSTAFNYPKSDKLHEVTIQSYKEKYNTTPTDVVFRGYESMYHFCKLLLKHKADVINNLSDPEYKVSNTFNIVPVFLSNKSFVPDYMENKHLYFITKQGAAVVAVD